MDAISKRRKVVQCLFCGKDAIQKTAKQRSFCSHKCKNAYWIRTPESKEMAKKRYRQIRTDAINHYGGKCECCGEKRYEFLAFDHIEGGGTKFRKTSKDAQIASYLKRNNYPKGIRLLCHNCNSAFGFYGYCPHGK